MNLMLEASQNTLPAAARAGVSYKQRLIQARTEYSPTIENVSFSLQGKLQKYYDALNGDYQYNNSHGKTVRARTYKKRLKLASKELESIQAHIQLSRKYGKIDETTALEISEYTQSLYNAAIKDNKYAKKHNISRRSSAVRLRNSLKSIEDRVIDLPLTKQNAPSNYNVSFNPQVEFRDEVLESLGKFGNVRVLEPRAPHEPMDPYLVTQIPYVPEKKKSKLRKLVPVAVISLAALAFIGMAGAAAYFTYDEMLKDRKEKEYIGDLAKAGRK